MDWNSTVHIYNLFSALNQPASSSNHKWGQGIRIRREWHYKGQTNVHECQELKEAAIHSGGLEVPMIRWVGPKSSLYRRVPVRDTKKIAPKCIKTYRRVCCTLPLFHSIMGYATGRLVVVHVKPLHLSGPLIQSYMTWTWLGQVAGHIWLGLSEHHPISSVQVQQLLISTYATSLILFRLLGGLYCPTYSMLLLVCVLSKKI